MYEIALVSIGFLWLISHHIQCLNSQYVCVCVFGFNVGFNNFSVISRRCLVATGSSMLTFIVLLHGSIMSQTLDMIPHPVTLSWHWVDQSYLYLVSLSAKQRAASTIFYDSGMSRPGIEPRTSCSPERTLYQLSYRGQSIVSNCIIVCPQYEDIRYSYFPENTSLNEPLHEIMVLIT